MLCPVCTDERLSMTERQGIEIDCCPKCRGVWLARGAFDTLIERAMQEMDAAPAPAPRVAAAAQPSVPPQGMVAQPAYGPVPYPPPVAATSTTMGTAITASRSGKTCSIDPEAATAIHLQLQPPPPVAPLFMTETFFLSIALTGFVVA